MQQNSGAFVGPTVGQDGSVTITNSYCIFNGSMNHSASIIGGKYLGSNGNITINKFYVITNITSINPPVHPNINLEYSYFLSVYQGDSLFNSITCENVNILNFGINNLNMYGTDTEQVTNITGITKHTTFTSFNSAANTVSAKVGDLTYYLNYKNGGTITSYKLYSPDDNIKYEILIGSNNKILLNRVLTFDDIPTKNQKNTPSNVVTSSNPDTTLYYSSSDTTIATINNNGLVTILNDGSVILTVYALCDEDYSYVEAQKTLTIIESNIDEKNFNNIISNIRNNKILKKIVSQLDDNSCSLTLETGQFISKLINKKIEK